MVPTIDHINLSLGKEECSDIYVWPGAVERTSEFGENAWENDTEADTNHRRKWSQQLLELETISMSLIHRSSLCICGDKAECK